MESIKIKKSMQEKNNYDTSSKILFLFIIITFITNVSIATIQTFVMDWWHQKSSLVVFLICLMFLRNICYILPAFAIKNKTLKITGVIISSAMVLYLIYNSILTI